MSDEILKRDQNSVTVMAGVTNDSDMDIKMLRVDPINKRLLTSTSIESSTGSVINPATEEKQDDIVTAIQNITIPAPVGGATEAKQDDQITQIDNLISDNIHTGDKELRVYSKGHVCAENSTSTPLGINGVFTGGWQDTLDYSEVIISVGTDKSSITNGLQVLWSADGINVHGDDVFTISANTDKTFSFPCQRRYVKIIYTNDGVAQTRFNLSTLLKRFASKGSSHRLADNLDQQDDSIVTKSMIAGFTTAGGGGIVNVKVNPSGALTVDVGASVLPTGAATSAKQDSQITLETTLNSLVGTLQILTQRLEVIASMANSGAPALRTIPIASVSTAVTGSLTTITNLTNFGTGSPAKEVADDINNYTAILSNINNIVVS